MTSGSRAGRISLTFAAVILPLAGCAQVPRQAVELSATVGRDIASVEAAHRELVQLFFTRMRADINRFIDQVYAPAQIRAVMRRQLDLTRSPFPEDRSRSLLLALIAATRPSSDDGARSDALSGMSALLSRIRENVDSMREELLEPLAHEEAELLASVDRAYRQIHYANSIVTGHLASVVDVHEAQSELFGAAGVDLDLRASVGTRLAETSLQISDLVTRAETAEEGIETVETRIEELKEALAELSAGLGGG